MHDTIRWSIKQVETIGSTQKLADDLAKHDAPEGVVVVASRQTMGRGRLEREWLSPEGGFYASVILRPHRNAGLHLLPLVGSLSVMNAIRKETNVVAMLRWPNDVTIYGKKVAGVIAEASYVGRKLSHVVLGVGINCNFPSSALGELAESSTTLMDVLDHEVGLSIFRDQVLQSFAVLYSEWEKEMDARLISIMRENTSVIGRRINVTLRGSELFCVGKDITDDGNLLVKTEHGGQRVLRVEELVRLREL